MIPFNYPPLPHTRLHGPAGYKQYESYRGWLRDEFLFRCVYCLRREAWAVLRGQYHIDHFYPNAIYPERELDYDNLLYCCSACNLAKGDESVPNPEFEMTQKVVEVFDNGKIVGHSPDARRIIRILGLDGPEYVEFRRLFIGIVQLTAERDPENYFRLMRYPENLPDLTAMRPPENTRPKGLDNSCLARRQRGDLPDVYV